MTGLFCFFLNFLFLQVIQGRLDSLAVATIKALTTVMHKSPAAKVTTAVSAQPNVVKDLKLVVLELL